MIRDEYKKEHQNEGLSNREIKGINKFGERAFYTSSVTKMSGNVKAFDFSFKISLIFGLILLALILISAIVNIESLLTPILILCTIFTLIMIIASVLWFTLIRKSYQKKIDIYRQKIKEISAREVKKRMSLYEKSQNK